MSHISKLLDTLPVCQDFNRSLCSRLNCRFVHLTEDDKVEVCDQRVAVCRDHANGQCRRKLCKYYHIPVALPPANIMATIFNQQPAQQPIHHQQQLAAASTVSPSEQKQQDQIKKQQLTITANANRATSATYTSLSNHNNNNDLMSSFSNNILHKSITEKNNNTAARYQHNTTSPPLSRQISSSTTNSFSAAQNFALASSQSPKSTSESSNIFAITTSTNTVPTPVIATTATNLSAVAIANAYTPTFQRFLKTQQLLTPTLGYYDIINQGLSNINTNCFTLLPSNPTYAAAPMLYTSATQHQSQDSSGVNNMKKIQLSTSILTQHPSNTSNLPEIVTTSTK